VRRVGAIDIAVHPLGGGSFSRTLDAPRAVVGEANVEVFRGQGGTRTREPNEARAFQLSKAQGGDESRRKGGGFLISDWVGQFLYIYVIRAIQKKSKTPFESPRRETTKPGVFLVHRRVRFFSARQGLQSGQFGLRMAQTHI
jgi:hypothetical protein